MLAVTVLAVLAASCSSSAPTADRRSHSASGRSTTTTTTTTLPAAPTSTSSTTSSTAVVTTTTTTVALAITSGASATAVAGSPFQFQVTTTCGSVPVITAHRLPFGFKLDDHANCSATIAGTARRLESGTHAVVITAASALGSVTQQFALTVNALPILRAKSHLRATVGVPLNVVVATSRGFPVPGVSTASPLPPGLTPANFGPSILVLKGTPATVGVYPISIVATNGVGPPVTATLVVTVLSAPGSPPPAP
jgi:hypothetical protein